MVCSNWRFWQSSTNILALSSAQETASNSPSVGEYRLSDGVVKWDHANTSFHPSRQHVGAFLVSHSQYFWRRGYPMPSLLQSVCKIVLWLVSNEWYIPSLTSLIRMSLELLNNWSSFLFQVNVELYLTNSWMGCMIGLMAYAQVTWFTSPNHDGALVMFVFCIQNGSVRMHLGQKWQILILSTTIHQYPTNQKLLG